MKRNSCLLGYIICSMAFLYWGCEESSSNDEHDVDCEIFGNLICLEGHTSCNGNSVQKCKVNSVGCFYWETVEQCEYCLNGACTAKPIEVPPIIDKPGTCTNDCTQDSLRCEGNVLQHCALGSDGCTHWGTKETCADKCEGNQCVSDGKTCDFVCNVGQKSCDGKKVMECIEGEDGCPVEVEVETCKGSCVNGVCAGCSNSCELGERKCVGKELNECVEEDGCTYFKTIRKCESACYPDVKKCSEDLPTCKLVNGRKATILQWTDGDTLWVRAKTDGTCNDYEYTADASGNKAWRNVRYDIRVHGIDAPECSKGKNDYSYYTCIKDTYYTNDNEPMGYESWVAASKLLEYKDEVTIYCEQTQSDGTCGLDATKNRFLAYIGYQLNNASYDFSTEHARKGYAFSRTDFQCNKRKAICDAQSEAQAAKVGIWSLADTPEEVFELMGYDKNKWLKYMPTRCKNAK